MRHLARRLARCSPTPLTSLTTVSASLGALTFHSNACQRRASLAQGLAEDLAVERERERLERARRRLLAVSEAQLRKSGIKSLLASAYAWSSRTARMWSRFVSLLVLSSPLSLLFPLSRRLKDPAKFEEEVVWPYVQWAIAQAGPTAIKLCQWVSTRDDLLPPIWCTRLATLQAEAPMHPWASSKKQLALAFGENWDERMSLDSTEPVGSGCVAQVYKGHVKGRAEPVAIKVVPESSRPLASAPTSPPARPTRPVPSRCCIRASTRA